MARAPLNTRDKPIEERICVFGAQGTGKTRAALETALWHHRRQSDAVFRVLDTDKAYERMMLDERYEPLTDGTVIVYEVHQWEEVLEAAREIKDIVVKDKRHDDWLIIDRHSVLWGRCQDHFIQRVFDDDLSDYWVTQRQLGNTDEGSPLDGWRDWGVINKMWRELSVDTIDRIPCHVYVVCEDKPLMPDSGRISERADIRKVFGRMGVKPEGQKDIPYAFHTVLLFEDTNSGYMMTAAKDRIPRDRSDTQGLEIGNFWMPYLVKVAGWST